MCKLFIYPFLDCDVYQNACTIGVTNHVWNPIYIIARELSFQDCGRNCRPSHHSYDLPFRYIWINYDREPSSFLFKTVYTIVPSVVNEYIPKLILIPAIPTGKVNSLRGKWVPQPTKKGVLREKNHISLNFWSHVLGLGANSSSRWGL